jgi:hypothetical protein
MSEDKTSESPWVLVEGPAPGAAAFLGRWLLAAVEVDQRLADQYKQNPDLKPQIDRLEVECLVEFAPAAAAFVERFMKNLTCFPLDLWDEWGEIFAIMAQIGFFRLTGHRYQMTVPTEISGSLIETALLRLATTEDHESFLHPERLVTTLSKADAKNWQSRLERLFWLQRVADRALLLEDN